MDHNDVRLNATTLVLNLTHNLTDDVVDDDDDYYYDYDLDKPLVTVVFSWFFIVLFLVVFIVGLGGNCLVCFAVWRNPRMRSATNIFLVNLAVADLLVVLICLPPTAAEDFFGFWHLGVEMCKIAKFVQKASVFVSVLTLTAISIERWMAICQPFMFRQTAVRARRIIAVVWLLSLACAVPDLVGMTLHFTPYGLMCQPSWPHEAEELHLLLIFVLFYLVPLVIMTFTYVRVALCLWRSGSMSDTDEAAASVPRAQMQLRRKKAKMLIVVVLLFAVCYLPVHMLFIFMVTGLLEYLPQAALPPLAMLAHWLCYFNSAINPVIYNFMSCNFRREFRVACYICCRRGSENRMTAYEVAGAVRSISPESTRRTRLSTTPNIQLQLDVYSAIVNVHNVNKPHNPLDPKTRALMEML